MRRRPHSILGGTKVLENGDSNSLMLKVHVHSKTTFVSHTMPHEKRKKEKTELGHQPEACRTRRCTQRQRDQRQLWTRMKRDRNAMKHTLTRA